MTEGFSDTRSRGGSVLKYLAVLIRFSFEIIPFENHLVTACFDTPVLKARFVFVPPVLTRFEFNQLIISSFTDSDSDASIFYT